MHKDHKIHTCRFPDCRICGGVGGVCLVCLCSRDSLLYSCPDKVLSLWSQAEIRSGNVIDLRFWKRKHRA